MNKAAFKTMKGFVWLINNREKLLKEFFSVSQDALDYTEVRLEESSIQTEEQAQFELNELDISSYEVGNQEGLEIQQLFSSGQNLGNSKIKTSTPFQKDSYKVIEIFKSNFLTVAAERRITQYAYTLDEIDKLGTKSRVIEVKSSDRLDEWERFMNRLRDLWIEDKAIKSNWSEKWKTTCKTMYFDSLSAQKFDHETIRRKLWVAFERVKTEVFNAYDAQGNLVYKEDKKIEENPLPLKLYGRPEEKVLKTMGWTLKRADWKSQIQPSIWDQWKANDFANLNFTMKQWQTIYKNTWKQLIILLYCMARATKTYTERGRVRYGMDKYKKSISRNMDFKEFSDLQKDIHNLLSKSYQTGEHSPD